MAFAGRRRTPRPYALAVEVIRTAAKAEKIVLFRYGLIAPLVLEALPRGELTRRAEEIAARQYEIPGSQQTSISVDTLLDWALRYRNAGFEALAPKPRLDRGKSRTITPQLADLIERLKRQLSWSHRASRITGACTRPSRF